MSSNFYKPIEQRLKSASDKSRIDQTRQVVNSFENQATTFLPCHTSTVRGIANRPHWCLHH